MKEAQLEVEPIQLEISELLGVGQLAQLLESEAQVTLTELSRCLSKAGGEVGGA